MKSTTLALLAAAAAFAAVCRPADAQCTGDWTDSFQDGTLGAEWDPTSGTCGQVLEAGGALILREPTGCIGRIEARLDPERRTLCGDFDVEIDFDLVSFPVPPRGTIRVFAADLIRVRDGRHFATIERFHETPGNPCVIAPTAYKSWTDGASMNCVATMHAATASAGTLILSRRGPRVSLGFREAGTEITARRDVLHAEPLRLRLRTSASGDPRPHEVRIEEVRITGTESACTNRVVEFDDDFEDGVLASAWTVHSSCGTPVEASGKLVLDKPSGCSGASGLELQPVLCGDFDARVRFDLVQFTPPPSGSWRFAKLDARFLDGASAMAIERFEESPGHPCITTSRHFKSFGLGASDPCDATMIATSAMQGGLRIERIDGTLSTYYDEGAGWQLARTEPITSGPLRLHLRAGSGNETSPQRVEFDDVSVRADSTLEFGVGLNPSGSLFELAGEPRLGTIWRIAADNPLGTQTGPGAALFLLSAAPDLQFPRGSLVVDAGMRGPMTDGELLVSTPSILPTVPWTGPGTPAAFALPLPQIPLLVGIELFWQAAILDANGPALTNGLMSQLLP